MGVGFKHTQETKELLSKLAKNRQHSVETKALISKSLIGENNPFFNKKHTKDSISKIVAAKSKHPVYIYNSLKNLLIVYPSVKTLANVINSNSPSIKKVIDNNLLFRGGWYFTSKPFNILDVPLVSDYSSVECNQIILEIKNSYHIRKAIFLFNDNKEFIKKYDGIEMASPQRGKNYKLVTLLLRDMLY